MITLDQIRMLDEKVRKAVDVIAGLRSENSQLRALLETCQNKISELEVLIDNFKEDQGEIEEGIQKALERLDHIQTPDTPAAPADDEAGSASDTDEDDETEVLEIEDADALAETGDALEQSGEDSAKNAELDIF